MTRVGCSSGLNEALRKWAEERRRRIEEARAFARRVRRAYPDARVFLFGSVARGDFHEGSDLDLLVVANGLPKGPLERLKALYRFVEGSEKPKGLTPEEFEAERRAGGFGIWRTASSSNPALNRRHPNISSKAPERCSRPVEPPPARSPGNGALSFATPTTILPAATPHLGVFPFRAAPLDSG